MKVGKNTRQYLVGFIASLGAFGQGASLGWSSPIVPKLTDPELKDTPFDFVVSNEDISWITSIIAVGALISPFLAARLVNIIGRKWTLLSSTVFSILSWILLITAENVAQMYIARLLQGFAIGFVMTPQIIYFGEIASDDCRGVLGSFLVIFIHAGILYAYCVGPYTSYYTFQYFCGMIQILFLATFIFMPESPHFYVSKGRKSDAIKSLKFLRGTNEVQEELNNIENFVEESKKNKGSINDIFKSKENLKTLIISSGLLAFQQFSGISVVLFYSQSIFEKATGNSLQPAVSTILLGLTLFSCASMSLLIIERLGRKPILLFSAAGMFVSLLVMGLYFYLDHIGSQVIPEIGWLPISTLLCFIAVYSIGFGPVPFVITGEIFPPDIKSSATSFGNSICWFLAFLLTKINLTLQDSIGSHGVFFLFAAFCGVAFFFTYFLVIETKGLTLQQIQDKLKGKK